MKKVFSVLALAVLLTGAAGCKDKKEPPAKQPDPPQYGTINIKVRTYDSKGKELGDHSGVQVSLAENDKSTGTDINGQATLSNLEYGMYTPVLLKPGHDGPKISIDLQQPTYSVDLPFPRHSEYKASNLKGRSFGKAAVYVSFNLDTAIPDGDTVKVAIIASKTSDLSIGKFNSSDLIKVTKTVITDYDISKLPGFFDFISGVDSSATYYVSAVPVSYGIWKSNLQPAPQLLGYNIYFPGAFPLVKDWKD